MKIVITGGTGSLGNFLADKLKDHELIIMSRDEYKQTLMKEKYPNIEYVIGDVRNKDICRKILKDCDSVIHCAAMKRIEVCEANISESIKTNILGAENVAEISQEFGINAIAISTDKAVMPVNIYGMCKAIQERIFTSKGFNIARYGNVIGSRGSVFWIFKRQSEKRKQLTVTNPKMTRFMLHLDGAFELIMKALKSKAEGKIFVKSSSASTVIDIAKSFSDSIKIIGHKSGEKIDEILITEEESFRAKKEGDVFVIQSKYFGDFSKPWTFTSGNTKRLSFEETKEVVEKWKSSLQVDKEN